MLKKIFCFALSGLLINLTFASTARAFSNEAKDARFIEQVKKGIAKLGTGQDARVEVKLHDKTKLKGYLSEVTAEHFSVMDTKTGAATQVLYPQVKQVKGHNLSTGARIAIGVIVGVALFIAVAVLVTAVTGGN